MMPRVMPRAVPDGLALLVLAMTVAVVFAADAAGAGGARPFAAGAPEADHAWAVVEREAIGGGVVLLHLPPRGSAVAGVTAGTARLVDRLGAAPGALAGSGGTVWWVEPRRASPGGGAMYPVRSITAIAGVGGLWRYDPAGRGYTHPGLPADGELLGFAAAGTRVFALQRAAGRELIDALGRDGWESIEGPGLAASAERAALLSDGSRVLLLARGAASGPGGWRGAVADAAAASETLDGDGSEQRGTGEPRALESGGPGTASKSVWAMVPDERLRMLPTDAEPIAWWRGELIWIGADGLYSLPLTVSDGAPSGSTTGSPRAAAGSIERARESVRLGDAPGPDASVSVQGGSGRVLIVEPRLDDDGKVIGESIREISLNTGRELFAGPAQHRGPISARDLQVLAVAMVMGTGLVLLIALRDPRGPVFELPDHTAMAEPGRRAMATIVDLLIGAVIVSVFTGQPVLGLMTLAVLAEPGGVQDVLTLFAVLALGGAFAEGLSGTTLGKRLAGCRVVSTLPKDRDARLPFLRCVLRNALKWGLPPLTLLQDAAGRHRGDALAGAAVIVDLEPEDG